MIEAEQLTKVYGSYTAVDGVSFSCTKGEIVGFLGPNGAGKTTTMRVLTGYLPPTSGAAYIAGHNTLTDSLQARKRLGYLPETVPLYPEMTVEGYLAFTGRIRKVDNLWERVDDVLESVHLLDRAESYISSLSKGMRQRVGLAQAMLHNPDVLILDEPTIGLDPRQVVEVRELIQKLGESHTILISTHILTEVEQLCNRVIMIIDGQVRSDMSMSKILGEDDDPQLDLKLANPAGDTLDTLLNIPGVSQATTQTTQHINLTFNGHDDTRIAIANTAVNAGWGLLALSPKKMSLENVFLEKLREVERINMTTLDQENEHMEEEE